MRHLQVADITLDTTAAAAPAGSTASQQITHTRTSSSPIPLGMMRGLQHFDSASSTDATDPQRGLMTSGPHHDSPMSTASDIQNPLLLTGGALAATSIMPDAGTSPFADAKSVAKQITMRCLRRWDGFLGIRAGSDGLGRRSGIWRDKFDGVRYAVLLLAMRKLNEALTTSTPHPSEMQLAPASNLVAIHISARTCDLLSRQTCALQLLCTHAA